MSVLGVLALPVLLAGVGLAAVRWCWRPILVALVALVAFCVLAVASVGLFYLPAAVAALVIAVVGWRHMPTTPPAADGPSAANRQGDIQGPG